MKAFVSKAPTVPSKHAEVDAQSASAWTTVFPELSVCRLQTAHAELINLC